MSQRLVQVVLLLAATLALYFGYQTLVAWTFDGLALGARSMTDTWPALALGTLVFAIGLCLLPGQSIAERFESFALAAIAWSMGLAVLAGLPDFASAAALGGGPILRPFYLVLMLGCTWFAFGGPLPKRRLFAFGTRERALLLFTFLGTANGKLFAREANPGFALLSLSAIVAMALMARGRGPREIFAVASARLGRFTLGIFAALPIWWFVAAANASSREPALQLAWRLAMAALVALVAVGSFGLLDRSGQSEERARHTARRVFGALVLGLGVVLIGAFLGVVEAAAFEPLERVLGSRLRVLGLHPNLGAALFAAGLPLSFGWIFSGASPFKTLSKERRLTGSFLFAGAVLVLYLSGSRASSLGAVIGLIAFGVLFGSALATKIGPRTWIGGGVLVAVCFALFLSPLGADLRGALDAKALTQSALGQRWHIWRMAGAAVGDHPWTGLGPLGFNGHAQYALSSYYDGTPQTLHTHNIFVAAAEGAGWIGLVLFGLFTGALLEALRRAIASSPRGHRDRAQSAAVFAAVLALLACNQLDLGQSQVTFIPLLFWSAITMAGLQSPKTFDVKTARSSWLVPAGLLLLVWPASGSTLIGLGRRIDSQVLAGGGKPMKAARVLESLRAPWFFADDIEVTRRLAAIARKSGDSARELAIFGEVALERPDSQLAVSRYAEALLNAGDFERGLAASQRALDLDPFGPSAAKQRRQMAWALMGLGQPKKGVDLLMEALLGGAGLPARLARQLDELTGGMDLVGRLDAVGDDVIASAHEDEVGARRKLAGLVNAFGTLGAQDHAVPILRGVIDASEAPVRATYYQLIGLLIELDREPEALDVLATSPFANDVNMREIFAGLSQAGDTLGSATDGEVLDVFFTAGRLKQSYFDSALDLAFRGESDLAQHELERALYNASDGSERVSLMVNYIQGAGGDAGRRQWQMRQYLERASVLKKHALDIKTMANVLGIAATNQAEGAELESQLGTAAESMGPIAATFRAALGQVKEGL